MDIQLKNVLHKDKIWIRVKNYIYLILFLIILLFVFILFVCIICLINTFKLDTIIKQTRLYVDNIQAV